MVDFQKLIEEVQEDSLVEQAEKKGITLEELKESGEYEVLTYDEAVRRVSEKLKELINGSTNHPPET